MSTRSTLAYAEHGKTVMHLYDEMHSDCVHLEITLEGTYISLNLVIPPALVPDVTEILKKSDPQIQAVK